MELNRKAWLRSAARTANRIGVTPVERPSLTRAVQRIGDAGGSAALRKAVDGKIVLVTGVSSGIGRATAIQLGAAGAAVLLVARSEDLLGAWATRSEPAEGSRTPTRATCSISMPWTLSSNRSSRPMVTSTSS